MLKTGILSNPFDRLERYEAENSKIIKFTGDIVSDPKETLKTKATTEEIKDYVSLLGKKRENQGNSHFQRDIIKEKQEVFDADKIKTAISKEQERRVKDEEMLKNEKSKKKPGVSSYLSKDEDVVTAEDMEAFRLMKTHFDDPMKNMKNIESNRIIKS